jgi:hypothetical protein
MAKVNKFPVKYVGALISGITDLPHLNGQLVNIEGIDIVNNEGLVLIRCEIDPTPPHNSRQAWNIDDYKGTFYSWGLKELAPVNKVSEQVIESLEEQINKINKGKSV